ncbi:MAG: membrane protein insertion efficiency factor YidD [Gammaproteobacteria bacterium]|nr:membrane protein insertion efficiency factor YidD [Gammaproteobacteria bacterium]
MNKFGQRSIRGLIKCYQWVMSPMLPMACRFYPTCSNYAIDAVEYYGVGKGIWKAVLRILRCHPWSAGGYDPVLPNKENE